MIKLLHELAIWLVWPEDSKLWPAFQRLAVFIAEGGFQNFGMSLGFMGKALLEFTTPEVYVPLNPYFVVGTN